jgi:SAM-dependent methyltransferase
MSDINTVKQFWDNRPCNIRHSEQPIGSKEYFNEVERKKFFVEPHILSFTNFTQWNGKSVLEIGCGIGTAAINFAKAGATYTGVELSEESLKLTKQRFQVYEQQGSFYSGNAEQLSDFLPEQKFDLIYSFGVIHHTPNPKNVINEIKEFMHKDSTLKIMVYAKHSWKNFMIESGLDQPEAQAGCPIAFTYTKEEIEHELLGSDFNIVSIDQDHIFPYQIDSYKKGEYIKQPWFEAMPDTMFKTLEKNLGWHMLVTATLR